MIRYRPASPGSTAVDDPRAPRSEAGGVAALTRTQARRELKRLTAEIARHDRYYYQLNAPKITDAEYDALRSRLSDIEQRFPDLRRPDSPSLRVGAPPLDLFPKIHHQTPVLSLDNVFNEPDFRLWLARSRRALGLGAKDALDLVAEPKIDGLTAVCRFENGVFVRGGTRGDGRVGEDVSDNLRCVREVPARLKGEGVPRILEVRGEVYMRRSDFDSLNDRRRKRGETLFVSARNAAAGSLRQLDRRITRQRRLHFFVHGWGAVEPPFTGTYTEVLRHFERMGLTVNPLMQPCTGESAERIYESFQQRRDRLAYEIDGVVFKVDRLAWQDRLGATSHAPRWALAYKFPGSEAQTVLKRIVIQVGRTGALTPVAELEPATLGGVEISRATLHNEDFIRRKDIREGDTVRLRRAGEVIPQVIEPVLALRPRGTRRYSFPQRCPACGSRAVRAPGEAVRRCSGTLVCPAQRMQGLRHFVSRDAANIAQLGPSRLAQLSGAGLIDTPADILRLPAVASQPASPLRSLPGWNRRSIERLCDTIDAQRDITLDRFIYALGIPRVGLVTARALARAYPSVDAWRAAMLARSGRGSKDRRTSGGLASVGPETATELRAFFSEPRNRAVVQELLSLMKVRPLEPAAEAGPLMGKTLVFTGQIPGMTRAQARRTALDLGAHVGDTVSRSTDMLVVGARPGSKLDRARKLGIDTLSAEEWRQLARRGGSGSARAVRH